MPETTPLVLVVDDDPDTRELYRMVFDMAGFRSADADTVASAVASCRVEAPDVTLSDWRLPDGDGLELADALVRMAETRHTALVAVTGVSMSPELLAQATSRGFSKVLQKPVLPEEILTTVEEMSRVSAGRRLRLAAELTQRYAAPVRRESGHSAPNRSPGGRAAHRATRRSDGRRHAARRRTAAWRR